MAISTYDAALAWFMAHPKALRIGAGIAPGELTGWPDWKVRAFFDARRELDPDKASKAKRRKASLDKRLAEERAMPIRPTYGEIARPTPKFRSKIKRL